MTIGGRASANWLVSAAVIMAILIVGRPLLVPLGFALVLWAILNALTDLLMRAKLPAWLAWLGSLTLISAMIYLVTRIVAHDAVAVAQQAPGYIANLERLLARLLEFLELGTVGDVAALISSLDVARLLGPAASSLGNFAFAVVQVAIYVGFLLFEQRNLPAKFARLQANAGRHNEGEKVPRAIASQLRLYLGVLTILSAIMAVTCYVLLTILGVGFADFWALVVFLLTYIPVVGAVCVTFPALMALAQFGSLGPAVIIVAVLGGIHFLLFNIAQTLVLGRSLNLSPFAIILSLTFWGLTWGIAGLFLAVPITAALAITCQNIEGLRWLGILLAAPEKRRSGERAPQTATPIGEDAQGALSKRRRMGG